MNRITVVRADAVVCVDGRCFFGIDMSSMPETLHAMQWYGSSGEEERYDAQTGRPVNINITNLDAYADVLAKWEEARVLADTPPPVEPEPVPEVINRRQCARQLFAMNLISGEEAVAMTQSGTPPAMVQQYINTLPTNDRYLALMDFAADSYYRDNALLAQLATINNMSSEDLDNFFRAAFLL